MAENDELRAAAERLQRVKAGELGVYDPTGRATTEAIQSRIWHDEGLLADAYLAHPTLTRERVAAAVTELAEHGIVVSHKAAFAVDHLCRLFGVVEGE